MPSRPPIARPPRTREYADSLAAEPDSAQSTRPGALRDTVPVVDFVTGYVQASAKSSRTLLKREDANALGLGDRHAVRAAGSTVAALVRSDPWPTSSPTYQPGYRGVSSEGQQPGNQFVVIPVLGRSAFD